MGHLDLFVNATHEQPLARGVSNFGGCRVVRLVAGDQLDVRLAQGSGTILAISNNTIWDWLTIAKL